MDANGNAVIAWQRYDGSAVCKGNGCIVIEASARSAAGTLSPIQSLSAPGEHVEFGEGPHGPQVAVDKNGDAVIVWGIYDASHPDYPPCCTVVQARARSAAGVLSGTQNLSRVDRQAQDPQVAIDQGGNAVFVWTAPDGTTDCASAGGYRIQTRARAATGSLSAVQFLSAPGRGALYPQLGLDQSGNAVFGWQMSIDPDNCPTTTCSAIQARARSVAGVLSTTQTLTGPEHPSHDPDVGVDQSGNAVFVYTRPDGMGGCDTPWVGCYRAEARTRSASGVLGAAQFLSDPWQQIGGGPRVAVNQSGNAAAVWRRFGGANWRVQAAVGP